MIQKSIASALKEAAAKCEGQRATPEVRERIKFEFILIMRVKHHTDWTDYASQINVDFHANGYPDVTIPPELLQRTLH